MTTFDLYWLAGLWEGEGCFGFHCGSGNRSGYPYATLKMTDKDVIDKVGSLLHKSTTVHKPKDLGHQIQYGVCLCSRKAIGLAMTLFPLLGKRRRARIKEIISQWKSVPVRLGKSRAPIWQEVK